MANITYADEVDPYFGIPWPEGQLRYDKGKLVCALSDYEVDELTERDPQQAETLTRLLLDQPKAEKDDPIAWGWTLPSWRRVMETWNDTKIHVILGGNRSSKTIFQTRMLMHLAMQIPEAELRSPCTSVRKEAYRMPRSTRIKLFPCGISVERRRARTTACSTLRRTGTPTTK